MNPVPNPRRTPSVRVPRVPLTPHASLHGLAVHAPTQEQLRAALIAHAGPSPITLSTLRGRDLVRARKDPTFKAILQANDLLLADGFTLPLIMRLQGKALPDERYRDGLAAMLLDVTRAQAGSVFFLGGRGPEPFQWARRAVRRFPELRIAGAYVPDSDYRDQEGARRLIERINASQASLVVATPSMPTGLSFPVNYGEYLQAKFYVNLWGGLNEAWNRPLESDPRRLRARHFRTAPRSSVQLINDA